MYAMKHNGDTYGLSIDQQAAMSGKLYFRT